MLPMSGGDVGREWASAAGVGPLGNGMRGGPCFIGPEPVMRFAALFNRMSGKRTLISVKLYGNWRKPLKLPAPPRLRRFTHRQSCARHATLLTASGHPAISRGL